MIRSEHRLVHEEYWSPLLHELYHDGQGSELTIPPGGLLILGSRGVLIHLSHLYPVVGIDFTETIGSYVDIGPVGVKVLAPLSNRLQAMPLQSLVTHEVVYLLFGQLSLLLPWCLLFSPRGRIFVLQDTVNFVE